MQRNMVGENNPNWRGGSTTCICAGCGKEFYREKHILSRRVSKEIFCSRACAYKRKRKREHDKEGSTGGTFTQLGRRVVYCPTHPRANNGSVFEHILIAEKVLGRFIPASIPIHHPNGKEDNSCLVICQDRKYHHLLHARARIVKAGGKPNAEKICSSCKQIKRKSCFRTETRRYDGLSNVCRPCWTEYQRPRGWGNLTRKHKMGGVYGTNSTTY